MGPTLACTTNFQDNCARLRDEEIFDEPTALRRLRRRALEFDVESRSFTTRSSLVVCASPLAERRLAPTENATSKDRPAQRGQRILRSDRGRLRASQFQPVAQLVRRALLSLRPLWVAVRPHRQSSSPARPTRRAGQPVRSPSLPIRCSDRRWPKQTSRTSAHRGRTLSGWFRHNQRVAGRDANAAGSGADRHTVWNASKLD